MKVFYLIGKYAAATTAVLSLGYLAIDGSKLLPPNNRSPQITEYYQKNMIKDGLSMAGGIFGFMYFSLKVKECDRAKSDN
jgi:hypothetical protein